MIQHMQFLALLKQHAANGEESKNERHSMLVLLSNPGSLIVGCTIRQTTHTSVCIIILNEMASLELFSADVLSLLAQREALTAELRELPGLAAKRNPVC